MVHAPLVKIIRKGSYYCEGAGSDRSGSHDLGTVLERKNSEGEVRQHSSGAIVNSGTSKNPHATNLVRCLSFLAATYEFRMSAVHLRGIHNTLADALSRNNLNLFRSLHPQANRDAVPIPTAALDLILLQEPDWTTKDWTRMWTTTWDTR